VSIALHSTEDVGNQGTLKARQRLTFSAFLKFVQINVYTITFPGDIILLLAMFQFSVTFAFKSLLSDVTQKIEC
jgi:hypothetical protein